MENTVKKSTKFSIATFSLAALCFGNAYAYESSNTEAKAKNNKASTSKAEAPKKSKSNKKNTPIASNTEHHDPEPNIAEHSNTEYACELGHSVVMYSHPTEQDSLSMRWKKRLYKLMRVETTTGANRYENTKAGLVWIDIPTKAMLLDSHRGQQLANECKSIKVASNDSQQVIVK
jgi:hypothetical protein